MKNSGGRNATKKKPLAARRKRQPNASRLSAGAAKPYFSADAVAFLRSLERNNRREWFQPRKEEYEQELKAPMLALIEEINRAMTEFSPGHVQPPPKVLMRIYRDTRFSSDKGPYKTHVAAWWSHAGLLRTSGAGYYLHLSAKEAIVAAGVYMPDRDQLLAIRTFLLEHHAKLRRCLENKKLRRAMESFSGEPLSRPPKGFPKVHPAMDLLLCRQWGVSGTLAAQAALRPNFAKTVIQNFRLAAPLVEVLNRPLVEAVEKKRRPLFGLR
ncbi:MAG TPA: DUF2461 domain-containing protein [Acidobacteriaceae bacterium]|nr:DUF2461 domain-containing protein [Acidobacteriaceae bacterium]